jgi:hypothetical protein
VLRTQTGRSQWLGFIFVSNVTNVVHCILGLNRPLGCNVARLAFRRSRGWRIFKWKIRGWRKCTWFMVSPKKNHPAGERKTTNQRQLVWNGGSSNYGYHFVSTSKQRMSACAVTDVLSPIHPKSRFGRALAPARRSCSTQITKLDCKSNRSGFSYDSVLSFLLFRHRESEWLARYWQRREISWMARWASMSRPSQGHSSHFQYLIFMESFSLW